MSQRAGSNARWAIMAIALGLFASPSQARMQPGDPEYQGIREYEQEVMARMQLNASARRGAKPLAIPDIFGPGSVLNVGNVIMKVTNNGILGNPFITSSDPSCQDRKSVV